MAKKLYDVLTMLVCKGSKVMYLFFSLLEMISYLIRCRSKKRMEIVRLGKVDKAGRMTKKAIGALDSSCRRT